MNRNRTWPPRWLAASIGFALLGVAVSGYLTTVYFNRDALVCGLGDCHAVQASRYAEAAGIPVAVLGLFMFASILVLGAARCLAPGLGLVASPIAFALALAGVVYSAYLSWLEVSVIHAICQWCVLSALLTLGVFVAESRGLILLLRHEFGDPLADADEPVNQTA